MIDTAETHHISILTEEILRSLKLSGGETVVDATLGGGGHTIALLEAVGSTGTVIAFDRDGAAIERFRQRCEREPKLAQALDEKRIILVQASFAALSEKLRQIGIREVSAIVADLGLSSDQLDDPERGFAFRFDAPLDMRFDRSGGETAADILNHYDEAELITMFTQRGGMQKSEARRLARAIIEVREKVPFRMTREISQLAENVLRDRRASIPPATKVFQALRTAVNREEEALEAFLGQAIEMLAEGGRIAIVSFHSGEDVAVKRRFREEARGCVCPRDFPLCRCGQTPRLRILTTKPVMPSREEIERNPRSRSARLRGAERVS